MTTSFEQPRTDITVVYGPPGTGKTTHLIGEVSKLLEAGVGPDRIGYLSFSKMAALEARERAVASLGILPQRLIYFRTLHSLAFKAAHISSFKVVMGDEEWIKFSAWSHIFNFSIMEQQVKQNPEDTDTRSYYSRLAANFTRSKNVTIGDEALITYAVMRNALLSPEDALHKVALARGKMTMTADVFAEFRGKLLAYKDLYGLIDFFDLLDRNEDYRLDVDAVFLDEAQDLTPQQWGFFWRILKPETRVTVAGDDDQSIYEYAGTAAHIFRNLKADNKLTLTYSHRLPRRVHKIAMSIIETVKDRVPKYFEPRDESGEILRISQLADITDDLVLRKDETFMMLARTRAQLVYYTKFCIQQGLVYYYAANWSNDRDYIRDIIAYERLRSGKEIDWQTFKKLVLNLMLCEPAYINERHKGHDKLYVWEDLGVPWDKNQDWMVVFQHLSDQEREYVRKLRARNEPLQGEGRIKILTMHTAKGLEADNVIMSLEARKKNFDFTSDEEKRVWYVAVTRTKKRLFLLKPRGTIYFRPLWV